MDVKTTFRNLVRDQSVSICMLHDIYRLLFKLRGIPLGAEKPANGDGLKEADPEKGHPRGGVEVHELEEEYPALCAHGPTQGEQQAAHTHCACVQDVQIQKKK